MTGVPRAAATTLTLMLLAACVAAPSPSSTTTPPTASPEPSPTETPGAVPTESPRAEPTATPEPPLSIELPDETDDRVISVEVNPRVGDEGGEIIVTVTSQASERIDELVLRWPSELGKSLFLAPFVPSNDRIRDGGPPLVQAWTKWVLGPGEEGEPAGTISLGYGPLLAGATLSIPLNVTRREDGAVAFDLQLLADERLLNLPDGEPAELRIRVP
jgi:hypothetical protein